jgi:hypothetical protein
MRSVILATIALAGAASVASADTVNLKFLGCGYGQNVRITFEGNTFDAFAGGLIHNFSNPTGSLKGFDANYTTFCCDLAQEVSSSGTTYTLSPLSSLPNGDFQPDMGSSRSQEIYNLYAAANGRQYSPDGNWGAAFQIALWEIIYDGTDPNMGDLTSGNVRFKSTDGSALSSAISSKVSELFTLLSGPNVSQTGLLGLSSYTAQDQILQVVPLPPAAWAGLATLGGAFVVRRARHRAR